MCSPPPLYYLSRSAATTTTTTATPLSLAGHSGRGAYPTAHHHPPPLPLFLFATIPSARQWLLVAIAVVCVLLVARHEALSGLSSFVPAQRRTLEEIRAAAVAEAACAYPDVENKEKVVKLLMLFNVVLDYTRWLGVPYYVDYGTLLGALRDERIFRNDHDVDFSYLAEDWTQVKAREAWLEPLGCFFTDNSHRHSGRPKGVVSCRWFHKKATEGADVYGWTHDELHAYPPTREGCRHGQHDMSKPCGICPVPKKWLFPLNCTARLHGEDVCVPADPFRHLTRLYGTVQRGAKCSRSRKYGVCCETAAVTLPKVQRNASCPPLLASNGAFDG